MTEDKVWYFAYGSNLNIGQMITRVGEWEVSKRAILTGHKLIFNCCSKRWGGLTANIVTTDNRDDQVYGVVYRIEKEKLDVLTRYEGVSPKSAEVEVDEEAISAKVYIFKTSRGGGRPPDAYLKVILTGLRQHDYPEAVIEEVRKVAIGETGA